MSGENVRTLFQVASWLVLAWVLFVDWAIIRRIAPVAHQPDRPISKMVGAIAALVTIGAVAQVAAVMVARPFQLDAVVITSSTLVRVVLFALSATIYIAGRHVFTRQEPFFTRPVQDAVALKVGVEPEQVEAIVRLFLSWPGEK